MEKVTAIKDFCTDILQYPGIHSQEVMDNLSISAGIVEGDITHEGCDDWSLRSTADTARYIMDKLEHCSEKTQSMVYFLLIEAPDTVH